MVFCAQLDAGFGADCARPSILGLAGQPVRYTIFSYRSRPLGYDRNAMVEIEPTRSYSRDTDDDDDWFGEGSVFESGEQLASALLALAGADEPAEAELPGIGAVEHPEPAYVQPDRFVVAQSHGGVATLPARTVPQVGTAPAHTWSVRVPGTVPIPPRIPGKSGWSIRNSVKMLHRAEQVLVLLREDALEVTLIAAARALHPDTSVPERRARY